MKESKSHLKFHFPEVSTFDICVCTGSSHPLASLLLRYDHLCLLFCVTKHGSLWQWDLPLSEYTPWCPQNLLCLISRVIWENKQPSFWELYLIGSVNSDLWLTSQSHRLMKILDYGWRNDIVARYIVLNIDTEAVELLRFNDQTVDWLADPFFCLSSCLQNIYQFDLLHIICAIYCSPHCHWLTRGSCHCFPGLLL